MADHQQDSDCTVDPETLLCTVCGVDHSGQCPDCGGRGFHKTECPESTYTQLAIMDAQDAFWQAIVKAILKPCPKCAEPFGARDLRKHIPTCKLPK